MQGSCSNCVPSGAPTTSGGLPKSLAVGPSWTPCCLSPWTKKGTGPAPPRQDPCLLEVDLGNLLLSPRASWMVLGGAIAVYPVGWKTRFCLGDRIILYCAMAVEAGSAHTMLLPAPPPMGGAISSTNEDPGVPLWICSSPAHRPGGIVRLSSPAGNLYLGLSGCNLQESSLVSGWGPLCHSWPRCSGPRTPDLCPQPC